MTATVRGRPTGPALIPKSWKDPLPDPAIRHQLPYVLPGYEAPEGEKRGWTSVPESLLHGGFQDLAVLVWAQLRLWFEDDARPTSYLALAAELGLDSGSPKAVEVRFSRALAPLLGTWIIRKRLTETQFTYQAVVPKPAAGSSRKLRYGVVARAHLAMLAATRDTMKVKPADIVDFARWQLECGIRGWTAESTKNIAAHWDVTPATVRASRKRLAELRFLEVVERGSRLSELVWLREAFDPCWMVRTRRDDEPSEQSDDATETANFRDSDVEQKVLTPSEESARTVDEKVLTPIGLTELLTNDLTELGGTSVPPLKLLPRESGDAPPPASRPEEHTLAQDSDHRRIAAELIGSHRVLAAAKPYFRTAMIRRITAALDQGLEPGRVSRALSLVVEAREFDAECLLLKQALEQARIEQRVGGCADCGTQDRHSLGCPQFDFTWEAEEPAAGSPLDGRAAATDPLTLLLQRPVHENPDELRDDAEILDWMIVQLARQIGAATDREAMLRAIWTRWRSRVKPDQRVLLDRANEHVRYALNLRRVS